MQKILAIDPGTTESAWLVLDIDRMVPVDFKMQTNKKVIDLVEGWRGYIAIEIIKSYGNVIGDDMLQTVELIGALTHAAEMPPFRLTRKEIVTHICGNPRARDKNVRQALLDRFGGRAIAQGKKIDPGPLYGVVRDIWSALAISITAAELYVPLVEG